MSMFNYYAIYKPYEMISQFSKEGNHRTLADLNFKFPGDVYPVGRLDTDSEGLLILTNDKSINHKLLNPEFRHKRTYCLQVEGLLTQEAKQQLEKGVAIRVDGKDYKTFPCMVALLNAQETENKVGPRNPPIRFRKNIPTSWIQLTLQEGKNRQVRKMTAAVGFPTLRLVRITIEKLSIENMIPGEVKELHKNDFLSALNI